MPTSPLIFARSFEQLKSRLRAQPAGDQRLLMLVEFWPNLKSHDGDTGYRSYFDEYVPLLLDHLTARNLGDLLPLELSELLEVILALRQNQFAQSAADRIELCVDLVACEAARKFFYVGAVDAGLACLARAEAIEPPPRRAEPLGGSAIACANLSEIDAIRDLAQHLSTSSHQLADTVNRILREWEVEREALSFEEANCLFVEKDGRGDTVRGRLRPLHGHAEYRRKGATSDEVTFESQLKAPDDPFVGVVYDALQAVGAVLRRATGAGRANGYVRARFSVTGSDHTFTGDSIGLAAGLVAYTQLLQPEVLKHERFVACEAAFTGGIDSTGRLTPVNEDTLRAKIERAFFSPVRYLVLPSDNLEAAQACVAELQAKHPRRRLVVVAARSLAEVIENRNIVRAERVCLGQFVARKAVKYSRATKIQVPLLLFLLATMLAIIFPKWTPWFDRNPQYVRITERGFDALNADSIRLWSVEYECAIDTAWSDVLHRQIGDLDGDGRNEVAFIPCAEKSSPCEQSNYVYLYDNSGTQLFKRRYAIFGEYPGDTSIHMPYNPHGIAFASKRDHTVIMTAVNQSNPGRAHVRLWNASGDSLGWYINAGYAAVDDRYFSDALDDGFALIGINNTMRSACLFILPRDTVYGASPPYTGRLKDVKRGNQLAYILFPPSDLCRYYQLPYPGPLQLRVQPDQTIRVETNESQSDPPRALFYSFDRELRVVEVTADDLFIVRRNVLADSGKLRAIDWPDYFAEMRDAVTYWTDSGWVTESQLRSIETSQ